ncbi:MAG: hybrid sensor histidine kinase/response regulator [Desulfobaccales bacterium]
MYTRSPESFQSIFDESPIGKEIFDADGRLRDINRSCLNIFGISEIPRIMEFNLFSDPNIPEGEKAKLRQGETVRCECHFDFGAIKQRGLYQTSRSGAAIIDCIISPLKKNDQITGFLAQLQDISEQKHTEEALRQSEEKYRLLVQQIPAVVFRGYIDGSIDFYDRKIEALTGYLKEDFDSRKVKWSDLIFPEDGLSAKRELTAEKETDRSFISEYRILKKSGEVIWVREEALICHTPLGKIDHISGIFIDITPQKDLEENLTRAYRELHQTQEIVMQQERLRIMGQIASGIAHDISNHLVPIIGHLDLLLHGDEALPAPLQEKYEAIQIAATDIASTIDRLRDFYRLQKQGEISSINLNVIIEQAINLTRFRWKNETQRHGRVIEMRQDLQTDLPHFTGVESEIRDALINLILNAIDAMPHHGSITLRSRFRDGHLILEVEDTGKGMDAETLRRCTDPFFTTKGLRGSGLGLVMVKGTMERYQGKVEINSQPGEGTLARLYFPYQKAMELTCPAPQESAIELTPLHILYVEDEPAVQAITRKMLEKDGHRVVAAGDGQTALATLFFGQHKHRPFDLVITDLGMPFMNGYELTAQIKLEYPEIPVAILTGWESCPADDEEKSQADFMLNKPIRFEKLRKLIREVISRKPGA